MPPLDRNPGWHFHDPHDILHEMPYTMHWKAAATDVCDISILFGPRPRMAASNDDCRACGRQGRGSKVANMDAEIPARNNTKIWECEILRAGQRMAATTNSFHRPLAPICPIVTYTLHYWTEAPYGCDIGILLKQTWQRVDVTDDGSSAV